MRLLFAIIILALSSATGFGQLAEFSIKVPTHKFPKTNEGVVLEHSFEYTNTGSAPLIISSFTVACSCTKVTLPKEPVPPGQKGIVKVTFDTQGRTINQDRTVILHTTTKEQTIKLRFKVYVKPKQ